MKYGYFDVFVRTWWRENSDWPDGLEPHAGEKHYLAHHVTREDALKICAAYNSTNSAGRYSKKAEFESV